MSLGLEEVSTTCPRNLFHFCCVLGKDGSGVVACKGSDQVRSPISVSGGLCGWGHVGRCSDYDQGKMNLVNITKRCWCLLECSEIHCSWFSISVTLDTPWYQVATYLDARFYTISIFLISFCTYRCNTGGVNSRSRCTSAERVVVLQLWDRIWRFGWKRSVPCCPGNAVLRVLPTFRTRSCSLHINLIGFLILEAVRTWYLAEWNSVCHFFSKLPKLV